MRKLLQVGDLKRWSGQVFVWVQIFKEDGEFIEIPKDKILEAIKPSYDNEVLNLLKKISRINAPNRLQPSLI